MLREAGRLSDRPHGGNRGCSSDAHRRLVGDDIGGIAVHIAARVLAQARPGEIWCSRTVKDLVAGAGFAFTDRGTHKLKGVPDDWRLYAVELAER